MPEITNFFEELDAKVFRAAMNDIEEELKRVNELLYQHSNPPEFARKVFGELIRFREVMVRFGEPRVVLTGNPEKTLEELFEFYVGRNFVNKEYHETVMETGLRKLLHTHLGARYVQRKIGDDDFHVAFPLVAMAGDTPKAIIKPLNLTQDDPTRIRERGNSWEYKVRELRRREFLPPGVLFALDGPREGKRKMLAYEDARKMLEDTGVTVLPFAQQNEILEFAISQAN